MSIIVRTNTASFTRPGDTTAYAAGDVVGPVTTPANLTFTLPAFGSGGNVNVRFAEIITTGASVIITNASFILYLFSPTNPTPIADNSPFTLLAANTLVGSVPIASAVIGGTGSTMAQITTAAAITVPMTLASSTLYGVLTANAAYAPVASQTFAVTLGIEVQQTNQL
jgi:hypothetical protein